MGQVTKLLFQVFKAIDDVRLTSFNNFNFKMIHSRWLTQPKHVPMNELIDIGVVYGWFNTYTCEERARMKLGQQLYRFLRLKNWTSFLSSSSSSSSCTRTVRGASCSLILKMNLVSFFLRILRVFCCALDRLPACRRWGCHLDASRPACFSVGVCYLSWMGPVLRRWTFTCTLSRLLQFQLHWPGVRRP